MSIDRILADPRYQPILAIIKGARNGLVYGAKVRFPHALVMTVLFSNADFKTGAKNIFKAVRQHSLNLCKYVTLYKLVMLLQRTLNKGKERNADPFLAGLVGGWVVFGDRNPINEQIVLYVLSRVVTSLLPRDPAIPPSKTAMPSAPVPPGAPYPKPRPPNPAVFKVLAALTWASVMWLFQHRRDKLQAGMVKSMQYMYLDSEVWTGLKTLLWHNR